MDKDESKSIVGDEISTEESESECVNKKIHIEKDANNEAEYEEHTVTYDIFVKETSYFNIFKCWNNILNNIDAKYKRACMATPRDQYYTIIYETLVDYNNRDVAPLSNEKLLQKIHKVITEEKADAYNITLDVHNVTMDTFCQMSITPNTQGENADAILKLEKLNN